MQAVIQNCSRLVQAANLLEVPVIVTEQYPQALGETSPEIAQHLLVNKPIAKTAFSAYAEPKFKAKLQRDKSHKIVKIFQFQKYSRADQLIPFLTYRRRGLLIRLTT